MISEAVRSKLGREERKQERGTELEALRARNYDNLGPSLDRDVMMILLV